MATTNLTDIQTSIQKFWAPMFQKQLIETNALAALLNREYEGQIKSAGNTVVVNQLNRPNGQIKNTGVDADYATFSPEKMSLSSVEVKADQVITAFFEIDDIAKLQSMVGAQDGEMRTKLLEAANIKLNNYLYGLVAAATPTNNTFTTVNEFNASALRQLRTAASKLKWEKSKGWWVMASPDYYGNLLDSQTIVSTDYTGGEVPTIGGEIINKRYGFNIVEDNSDGLLLLDGADVGKAALAFHPDFMYLVMQEEPQFFVADGLANNEFVYKIGVRMIVGAKIGIAGADKFLKVSDSVV